MLVLCMCATKYCPRTFCANHQDQDQEAEESIATINNVDPEIEEFDLSFTWFTS